MSKRTAADDCATDDRLTVALECSYEREGFCRWRDEVVPRMQERILAQSDLLRRMGDLLKRGDYECTADPMCELHEREALLAALDKLEGEP